jgi:hypothetical protein
VDITLSGTAATYGVLGVIRSEYRTYLSATCG